MSYQFTDANLKKLRPPESGNRIVYDDHPTKKVRGLGLRITAVTKKHPKGHRSFILGYRVNGRERRMTLGEYGPWTLKRAREHVNKVLRPQIDAGKDPLAEREDGRKAPTVADLVERFEREHLPRLRPKTAMEYRSQLRTYVLPEWKHRKVGDISFSDVDRLHQKITAAGAAYRANRIVSTISKMFALARRWGWVERNPARGIQRNDEEKRHRYLSPEEIDRFNRALAEHPDQQAADVLRMLLLTGARKGEVLAMRWNQLDLSNGVWAKTLADTKQKRLHRVPLNDAAVELLRGLRAQTNGEYVFPGRFDSSHRVEVRPVWLDVLKTAGITDVRIHDLRHSFASLLVSSGMNLPVIGALLGHSNPGTTARYSHLYDSTLREAAQKVGAAINGKV